MPVTKFRPLGFDVLAVVIIVIVLTTRPEPTLGATCGALLLTAAGARRRAVRRDISARLALRTVGGAVSATWTRAGSAR